MSFLANLIKWKVPRTSTDASGNTVLVGADETFRLPKPKKKLRSFSLIENFTPEQGKTFSVSGAAADSTYKMFQQGYRATLTYDGTGSDNAYIEVNSALKYAPKPSEPLVLAVYIHESNAYSQLGLIFSNNIATHDVSYFFSIGARQAGYYFIPLTGNECAVFDTPPMAGHLQYLRCYARQQAGSAGQVTDVTFLGVFQGKQQSQIVIQFDDALQSVYNIAFPMMQAKGLVGSIPIIGTAIGGSYETYPCCTAAQLLEMQAAGWELCVHSASLHSSLATEAAISADIAANKAGIAAAGITHEPLFVYAGGSYVDPHSFTALAANGFTNARSTGGIAMSFIGQGITEAAHQYEYLWPATSLAYDNFTPNLSNLRTLTRVVKNGIPQIFYAHGIKSGATVNAGRESTDIASDQLQLFVDRVAEYRDMGLVDVVGWKEIIASIPVFDDGSYSYVD